MSEPAQSYKNHTKFVPAFHFVAVPILLVNFIWAAKVGMQAPATPTILAAATALALLLMAFLARMFALKAQDRVIRLEMRMLLRELWPAGLHPKISEFTTSQLIALRFASDAELPELAQTVLRDGITNQKQIKLMIKNWKADHQRV
ncbi:MAG TPA: DUF6526 family protein [Vicinamibacterales bacterium]|nr:DUF6526 family protein [Vicinamibacterales bacterium]